MVFCRLFRAWEFGKVRQQGTKASRLRASLRRAGTKAQNKNGLQNGNEELGVGEKVEVIEFKGIKVIHTLRALRPQR